MAFSAAASPYVGFRLRCSSSSSSSTPQDVNVLCISWRRRRQRPLPCLHVPPLRISFVTSARRRRNQSGSTTELPLSPSDDKFDIEEDDHLHEDAFEALFAQLEEDLQNNDTSMSDNDEVTEDDLMMLEKELADALSDEDYDEFSSLLASSPDNVDTDEESEERHPKLKNWQLRRLAVALKTGRRKTNIKRLAAELGLDRAFVLELLRNPPPPLLLLSASLPATIKQHPATIEEKNVESPPTPVSEPAKVDSQAEDPFHIMQSRWSAQKRMKKVQVEVLERVYCRTKRPTNAMISSIIEVTNLPRRRVVKWFEDKRVRDGIPEKRVPFHR